MIAAELGSDTAFGWTEEQLLFRNAVRRFVETEVVPRRAALEFGDLPPYDVLRAFYKAFDVGASASERFEPSLDATLVEPPRSAAETLIAIIELPRHSPGLVTAMGVSVSLTAGAILRAGSRQQKQRWASELLTLETIGCWAITEPDSGSDAFGSMRASARAHGDGWVLNGAKTFITNSPYADTIVFICKLDDGPPRDREVPTFVLDRGMPGSPPTSTRARTVCSVHLVEVHHRRATERRRHSVRRCDGAGHHRSMSGAVGGICQRANSVRSADRRVPVDPTEAGADGGGTDERGEHRAALHRDGRRWCAPVPGRGFGDEAVPGAGRRSGRPRSRPVFGGTATCRRTRSSSCVATRRCCRSTAARTRSR